MAGLGLHCAGALEPQRNTRNHDPLSAQRCHKGLPATGAPRHGHGIRSEVWRRVNNLLGGTTDEEG